ncbi:MAG: DUF2059 domain-containing protein [Chitinophagaceae bacterium]
MSYKIYVFFIMLFSAQNIFAQDSTQLKNIFERITSEVQSYKIDTSAVAEDRFTKKVRELRALKGGFNINEAIEFKMGEEAKEGKISQTEMDRMRASFTNGKAKQWLDNAVIHIYRQHFSYKEMNQLVKFYKTSAGQKLASDFPMIMMKSLMAAQVIHGWVVKK